MVTRRGGALPLGEGRIGVPITGETDAAWLNALRAAMPAQRPDDDRWAHAAAAVTVDQVQGVQHLVIHSSDVDPVDFMVTYVGAIDTAIAEANAQVRPDSPPAN